MREKTVFQICAIVLALASVICIMVGISDLSTADYTPPLAAHRMVDRCRMVHHQRCHRIPMAVVFPIVLFPTTVLQSQKRVGQALPLVQSYCCSWVCWRLSLVFLKCTSIHGGPQIVPAHQGTMDALVNLAPVSMACVTMVHVVLVRACVIWAGQVPTAIFVLRPLKVTTVIFVCLGMLVKYAIPVLGDTLAQIAIPVIIKRKRLVFVHGRIFRPSIHIPLMNMDVIYAMNVFRIILDRFVSIVQQGLTNRV